MLHSTAARRCSALEELRRKVLATTRSSTSLPPNVSGAAKTGLEFFERPRARHELRSSLSSLVERCQVEPTPLQRKRADALSGSGALDRTTGVRAVAFSEAVMRALDAVTDPAPEALVDEATHRSSVLRHLVLLPASEWRLTPPPDEIVDFESGIAGATLKHTHSFRGVRAHIEDLSLSACTPIPASDGFATRCAFRRGVPPPEVAPGGSVILVVERSGLTMLEAVTMLANKIACPVDEFQWIEETDSSALSTQLCAVRISDDRLAKLERLRADSSLGSRIRFAFAECLGLPPGCDVNVQLATASHDLASHTECTILLRQVPGVGRRHVAEARRHHFINFIGPSRFGFGRVKRYHAHSLFSQGKHKQACVALSQCFVDADPRLRLAYLQYRRAQTARVLTNASALRPSRAAFVRRVAELLEADAADQRFREAIAALDSASAHSLHTAIPDVVWNLAASHRCQDVSDLRDLRSESDLTAALLPPTAESKLETLTGPATFAGGLASRSVKGDDVIIPLDPYAHGRGCQEAARVADALRWPDSAFHHVRRSNPSASRLLVQSSHGYIAVGALSGEVKIRPDWFLPRSPTVGEKPADVANSRLAVRCPAAGATENRPALRKASTGCVAVSMVIPRGCYTSSALRGLVQFQRATDDVTMSKRPKTTRHRAIRRASRALQTAMEDLPENAPPAPTSRYAEASTQDVQHEIEMRFIAKAAITTGESLSGSRQLGNLMEMRVNGETVRNAAASGKLSDDSVHGRIVPRRIRKSDPDV